LSHGQRRLNRARQDAADAAKPDLERHCGATLVDCQEPQFLHYALAENRFRIQQQGLLLAQRNYSSEAR